MTVIDIPGIYDVPEAAASFWRRVAESDGCWLWTGSTTTGGYGNLRWEGGFAYAHRVAYTLAIGPIPAGMVIDHLCRVRRCVRPATSSR